MAQGSLATRPASFSTICEFRESGRIRDLAPVSPPVTTQGLSSPVTALSCVVAPLPPTSSASAHTAHVGGSAISVAGHLQYLPRPTAALAAPGARRPEPHRLHRLPPDHDDRPPNLAQHVNGIVEVTPQWTPHCFNCH